MIDYQLIGSIFKFFGWQWKVDKNTVIPDVEAIKAAVARMRQTLADNSDDELQLTVGHLIMQKDHDNYDVYVHCGTINATQE